MKKYNTTILTVFVILSVGAFFYFNSNNANKPYENPKLKIQTSDKDAEPSASKVETSLSIERVLAAKTTNAPLEKREAAELLSSIEIDEVEEEDMKGLGSAKKLTHEERFNEAKAYEFELTKDPALGYVPIERKRFAVEQTRRMQAEMASKASFSRGNSIQKNKWIPRGPGNVGGRARAILMDAGDLTRNTMFAGGTTGGLFKTTNLKGTSTRWTRINDYLDNLTVSSLAQDPKNPKIMYFGTGDVDGNDASGNGIYKSEDGGSTWAALPSTLNTTFYSVASILITPDSGHIIVGTFAGMYKSKNGGVTWDKVLGAGFRFGSTDDKFYTLYRAKNGNLFTCNASRVFKSTQGGDLGTWQSISRDNGFPTNLSRVEMAVAPSDPNVIYIVGEIGGSRVGSAVYKTTNGGDTWAALPKPLWSDGCQQATSTDFTRGQANYDLSLAVSPDDPNIVFLGGIDVFKSSNGGQAWQQISNWAGCSSSIQYAHADQHGAYFEPDDARYLYLTTDGGVFMVENPTTNNLKIAEKTEGFITTQFYACAINPDSGVNQFMAGAQDNGTLIVRSAGIGNARGRSIGGDGFLCFIDQNESNIQIGSLYFGRWYLSTDVGNSFSATASSNGGFLNPADYDSKANTLYAQTRDGELWRWKLNSDKGQIVNPSGANISSVSNVYVDDNVPNRVYVGTFNGTIYRVDNAHTDTLSAQFLTTLRGAISCIAVEKGDSNHILATSSSYGVKSVYESKDGGATWVDNDGNLPDMPVRWVVFNPNNKEQALIATDAGVWSTDKLDGSNTVWNPPFIGRGSPIVRTDMLKVRQSDKTILAGTYGRGMWTTSSFSNPSPTMDYNQVTYLDAVTNFKGDLSSAADAFNWDFGDGGKDTLENTVYNYKAIGVYNVSLKINSSDDLITKGTIKVLPQLPTPYKVGSKDYDGSFEGTNVHFGAYSPTGTKFERGKSKIFGKDGTHTGNNAYVLGLNDAFYKKNTLAYLYTPMYDMTEKGIYQFSFWSLFNIERAYDGMQVEYSLDKGTTWQVLGSNEPNWYTYRNTTLTGGAFPIGTNYFSVTTDDWTRFKINITGLAGNKFVAFRFVFKASDQEPQKPGVAIDDIEVTKFTGELKTVVTTQGGEFINLQPAINVKFQTQPEYLAKAFQVEVSTNGRNYTLLSTPNAKGRSTDELNDYLVKYEGARFDIYYFRIKALHEDSTLNFYTPSFVVKKDKNAPLALNKIYPNPIVDRVGISFTDVVNDNVVLEVYDVIGRLVSSQTVRLNNAYHEFDTRGLAAGVYVLSIKVGENEPFTQKVFKGN